MQEFRAELAGGVGGRLARLKLSEQASILVLCSSCSFLPVDGPTLRPGFSLRNRAGVRSVLTVKERAIDGWLVRG